VSRPPHDDRTYDSVRDRFRQWREANPRPRGPSALGFPEVSDSVVRMGATVAGLGIGAFLLALAVTCFVASRSWGTIDRGGAVVAYFLAGLFLTVAGLGCILATLSHNFRVLARPPAHH
jgi:hypothetical protein